jgi:iron complex outermembrane receptor protein
MKRVLSCTTALTVASALMPAVALAQDDDRRGSTIVVTAERRAENVQDVPISIVALSGETLRERGVETLADLVSEVPSLSFVDNGNTKFINIRGIGITESAPNQTVGIAVHQDGAYVAREFNFNDAFFDVESIQILRGPQGTYSGQNASGGAIFIESAKPVLGDATGFAQATLGNFARRELEAAVSVPLADNLAARFSTKVEDRGSYYTNLGPTGALLSTGERGQPGDRRSFVGRAQLLWEPTDTFQARIIHQFSRYESDGTAEQIYDAANIANPFVLYYNETPYDGNITRYQRTTGVLRWDPTDAFRVNFNLAYQDTSLHKAGGDQDLTSAPLRQGFTAISDDYFTGEVNLVSMDDGPFEWTVGATFLDYKQVGDVYSERTPAAIANAAGRNFEVMPTRKNQAFFGEVGYQFTDALQIKIGGRYNHERNGFASFLFYPVGGLDNSGPEIVFPSSGQFVSFNNFTGRALVNWTPNPDHLVYATISRGYKPGGITGGGQPYGSEVVTNWEGGWKGTLLDGALQTSVSAFWMDYDGFQGTVQPDPNDPTSRLTRNIDNTRVKGIEAQITTYVGNFSADVGVSILDTGYGPFNDTLPPGADGNTAPTLVSIGGRQLNYAPDFSITGGISYDIPAGDGFVTPSVRVSHTSEQYVTYFQLPYHRIDSRTLVDARLSYAPNDTWIVTAYATNLFDETYIRNASQTTNGVGQFQLGAPREYGVTLAANF